MESKRRRQQIYDHRLVQLVQQAGDPTIATRLGVPRSTVAGWLRRAPRTVTTTAVVDSELAELRTRVARLEELPRGRDRTEVSRRDRRLCIRRGLDAAERGARCLTSGRV